MTAPVSEPVPVCSNKISQNCGASEEVVCSKCWEIKDRIEILISELKSMKLTIKLLQEDIYPVSPGTRTKLNLTNHVGYNT
jgi:hypothetical protein